MTAMPSHVRRHRDERVVVVGRVCSVGGMCYLLKAKARAKAKVKAEAKNVCPLGDLYGKHFTSLWDGDQGRVRIRAAPVPRVMSVFSTSS